MVGASAPEVCLPIHVTELRSRFRRAASNPEVYHRCQPVSSPPNKNALRVSTEGVCLTKPAVRSGRLREQFDVAHAARQVSGPPDAVGIVLIHVNPAVILFGGCQGELHEGLRGGIEAGDLVARYLFAEGETDALMATLGRLLLREDRDFHTIQTIEAAFRQYSQLRGTPEATNVLVAAGRYLAAHAPTMRAQGQTFMIAQRLQRGERLFEE